MNFYVRFAIAIAVAIGLLMLVQEISNERPPPAISSSKPVAQPAAAAQPAAPAPPQSAELFPGADSIRGMASKLGLNLTSMTMEERGWIAVTVQGRDKNHVAAFLDEARKLGMRDVDTRPGSYRQFYHEGRTVVEETYRIKF